ncbi:MAG: cytochrome c oxidase assembly protein [Bryobacteraceae bacterium]|jgi:cytochrome c oxidase assembly factor CtaG
MPPALQHILITLFLVGTAFVYVRGWIHLSRTLPNLIARSRLAAFLGGLALLWIAVASPFANLDDELLIVHMLQHLLIMTVAAPLILLGTPAVTLLHGLPQSFVRTSLGPVLRSKILHWMGRCFTHPVICWLAGTGAVLAWHIPRVFELGMSSEVWHAVEHGCFLAAGLLFWWPIVQPWPSVARLPQWSAPLYLFLATLPCDALSAFLTFCDRVVYPSYMSTDRLFDLSALQDQQWAGTLMWVWVTFAYLAPAASITMRLLSPRMAKTVEYSR